MIDSTVFIALYWCSRVIIFVQPDRICFCDIEHMDQPGVVTLYKTHIIKVSCHASVQVKSKACLQKDTLKLNSFCPRYLQHRII